MNSSKLCFVALGLFLSEIAFSITARVSYKQLYHDLNNLWGNKLAKLQSEYDQLCKDRDQLRSDRDQLRSDRDQFLQNVTVLEKDLEYLEKGLKECKYPVQVRAFIDIFLQEKFPDWSETIVAKGPQFERIIANVNDPVINAIRYILTKTGTVEDFGKKIFHGGLEFAAENLHLRQFPEEATPYVLECVKSLNPNWVKAAELMIAAILKDEKKVDSLLEELGAPRINNNDVKELQQLTVLRIQNLTPKYLNDEMKIRELFKDQNPLVVTFVDKDDLAIVYIKFSIFEEARVAWEKVTNNLNDFIKGANKKHVRVINEYNINKKFDKPHAIRVFCSVDMKHDQEFLFHDYTPEKEVKANQKPPYTLYKYKRFFDAGEIFHKNRDKIKTLCPNRTEDRKWIKVVEQTHMYD